MRVVQLKNWLHVKFKIGLYKIDHTCSVTVIHMSRHHSRSRVPAAFYIGKELAVFCLCKLECHILSKSSCHTTVGHHLTHLRMGCKPSATTGSTCPPGTRELSRFMGSGHPNNAQLKLIRISSQFSLVQLTVHLPFARLCSGPWGYGGNSAKWGWASQSF